VTTRLRPAGEPGLVGEERVRRSRGRGLRGCEQLEGGGAVPVPVARDLLDLPGRRVDDEHGAAAPATCASRIDPAARTWTVEALAHCSAAYAEETAISSERVLELLHHQLAPPRRPTASGLPQRLALLVLAHAVEVESGRALQEQPAPSCACAPDSEKRGRPHEPRVHEQRSGAGAARPALEPKGR